MNAFMAFSLESTAVNVQANACFFTALTLYTTTFKSGLCSDVGGLMRGFLRMAI
jgi:hypothetical protein